MYKLFAIFLVGLTTHLAIFETATADPAVEQAEPTDWVTRWVEIRLPLPNYSEYLFNLNKVTFEDAMTLAVKDPTIGHFAFAEDIGYAQFFKGEPEYFNSIGKIFKKTLMSPTVRNGAQVWQLRVIPSLNYNDSVFSGDFNSLEEAIEQAILRTA